jgi:hypothetical protein
MALKWSMADDQQGAALHTAVADALHLIIEAAPVQQPGQWVGQRQALHQFELAAQPLDFLGTFLQVLMVDAGLDAHTGGLADQRLDHLADALLAAVIAQPIAIAIELVAVVAHLVASFDRQAVDMIDHAGNLGTHACRGVDIAHGDVRVEQLLDIPVGQHRRL